MSWHRFPIMHYDDIEQNCTFRCDGPRKSALKKPHREVMDCRKNTNNNFFGAFTKCNEYKNKKTCTFKPCKHPPVLHSTVEQPPSCFGDRTKNKRINTDYVCFPESDIRTTKKRTRFTEATGVRSPCSILSLQSKHCQGNPYVATCPKHRGVCQQNEAEVSKAHARCCEIRRRNFSTDFCQPTCNDYNPRLGTCEDDLPCLLDKTTVYRKCRSTKNKKKLKNKKTGGDACMCNVEATTCTNEKSKRLKTIKPRRRDCCWNTQFCPSYDNSCCKYYKNEGTTTKDKSCCSKGRPRIDESQITDCCHNTCPGVDFVDEVTGTNHDYGCCKIIKPRFPGCHTIIPECQKLTPTLSEYQLSKCSKMCDKLPECIVDEAVGTCDKFGCSKEMSNKPICQIPEPEITHCQNCERKEIRPRSCTDHCEYYKDSATDTLEKEGCFKVIRPRLRECSRPKWYEKQRNKPCVGSDFYKDASTITTHKYKSRSSRSKIIRPRIHGCQYPGWNCFNYPNSTLYKSKSCTCCLDNADICKCQQFNWKKIFRRKTKVCTAGLVTCGRIPDCQRTRNPCVHYVNVEDECDRPLCDVSAQCVENHCQNPLTGAREIMIKSTALCSSNKCDPYREVYYEHPNLRQLCVKCCNPCAGQRCPKCKLFNCFERFMIGTVALCCCPCFLLALSYWFVCHLLTKDCKKANETFRTMDCRDVLPVQVGNCNKIQRNCTDTRSLYCINNDQNSIFNAPPGYTVVMYNNKGTDTACLPNPCSLTCNEEENVCNKNNKVRTSKRCKKKSCPNPQRKYNLYYVQDRGWVIKPISDGACGGGDNNLNIDTCFDNTDPNICSTKNTLICERLNYENPCISNNPDLCQSQKTFCDKVNYECDNQDCADPHCLPQKTFCDVIDQNPYDNCAEPETVIYCERSNYEDACCSNLDQNSPVQKRLFCERVRFQDHGACYDCTSRKDRTVCCSKPWRPSNCICISDCKCPKPFWKRMFCKSKTGNKCQMWGNKYYQSHTGRNNQNCNIGNSFCKAKMRSSYEKSKSASNYEKLEKRAMRREQNKSKLGCGYIKSIISKTRSAYHKSKIRQARANWELKMRRTYRKSKTRFRKFCSKFDRIDKKFGPETGKACQEMVNDIVVLRPSMKQTFGEFSLTVLRLFRFILVSCCCCPVFCCFYCCNVCCYRMYCNVMC